MRTGSYKLHARIGAGLREFRVFREKAIAGMNGVRARALGHVENLVHPQVSFGCRSWANRISFVRLTNMERGAVNVGINDDGCDTHFAARAQDAYRDLSSISDQNFLEHYWFIILRRRPDFTCA